MRKLLGIVMVLVALGLFTSCASIKQHRYYAELRKEQKFSEDSIWRIANAYRGDSLNIHGFYFNQARWMRGRDASFFTVVLYARAQPHPWRPHLVISHYADGRVVIYDD
jgi:hypothetical protein